MANKVRHPFPHDPWIRDIEEKNTKARISRNKARIFKNSTKKAYHQDRVKYANRAREAAKEARRYVQEMKKLRKQMRKYPFYIDDRNKKLKIIDQIINDAGDYITVAKESATEAELIASCK